MSDFVETTCAVVRLSDGFVINMIIAAPSDPAPDGCQLVEVMARQVCDIGWYWANNQFNGPRTYAMRRIDNGEVVSFLTASYVSPIPTPPEGYVGVEVMPEMYCRIGWTWDGVKFNQPVAV